MRYIKELIKLTEEAHQEAVEVINRPTQKYRRLPLLDLCFWLNNKIIAVFRIAILHVTPDMPWL